MKKILRGLLLTIVSIASLGQDDCDRFPSGFYVVARGNAITIHGQGEYHIDSSCPRGEYLLGGSFNIPAGRQIAVLGTYPYDNHTWRVIVYRGPFGHPAIEDVIASYAYCMKAPFNVDIETKSIDLDSPGDTERFPMAIATCGPNSIATGGGYRIDKNLGTPTWNSYIMATVPYIDGLGMPLGWFVALGPIYPGTFTPRTTVYARCSNVNLVAAPAVVKEIAIPNTGSLYDFEVKANCPKTTFTTGGGYSLLDNGLTGRVIDTSQAEGQLEYWHVDAKIGMPPPNTLTNFPARPCAPIFLNPTCKPSAIALCINIPTF